VNALIYIAYSASLMAFGFASDIVERKRLLSRTVSRKAFEATALIGAAVFMAIVPAVGCNQISVIVLLILAMIVLGLISGGDAPIVVDIAPDYSGSLYGFTNAFASLPGFLAPLFVGLVLDGTDVSSVANFYFILN
jgi:MFS family permease